MKRLVKKAEDNDQTIKDIRRLEDWISGDHRGVDDSEIQSIIDRNQDCIYSGVAYRLIQIFNLSTDSTLEEIEQHIKIGGRYQSFSKSYNYLHNEAEHGDACNRDESVIIKSNVSGLDVNKYLDKHKDTLDKIVANILFYPEQEEVIAKLEDYDIIYAFGNEVL